MATDDQVPAPSRRQLLRGLASTAGLAAAGIHLSTRPAGAAPPATTTWDLEAVQTSYSFGNGTTLPFFRFQPLAGGATRGVIPFLEAVEGSAVTVSISNQLPIDILPTVLGVERGPVIPSGGSDSFTFTMPPAGTYLLTSFWWGGPMPPLEIGGTSGVMVSRPSSGLQELWHGGPSWDREYVLLYEDTDSRTPLVTDQAGGIQYEPDYFTLDGFTFPETVSQPDTLIAADKDDRILIRHSNLGCMRQSIHYHGFHVDVAARNNVPETFFGPKDTIPVPHGETVDVILTANQKGKFPVHPHSLTAVTAGGLYPLGQLTLIDIN